MTEGENAPDTEAVSIVRQMAAAIDNAMRRRIDRTGSALPPWSDHGTKRSARRKATRAAMNARSGHP